jgi:hypothetical protein
MVMQSMKAAWLHIASVIVDLTDGGGGHCHVLFNLLMSYTAPCVINLHSKYTYWRSFVIRDGLTNLLSKPGCAHTNYLESNLTPTK